MPQFPHHPGEDAKADAGEVTWPLPLSPCGASGSSCRAVMPEQPLPHGMQTLQAQAPWSKTPAPGWLCMPCQIRLRQAGVLGEAELCLPSSG